MTIETRWTLAILGYFGAQVAFRLLFGSSLQWDEAEALLHARELAWGYGGQPPLYFWLQWGAFQVLGEGLLALALLKNALLAATMLLIFRFVAREVPASEAGPATLAVGLLPVVSWEAQRALTHSVMALLLAVAALWLFVRALERGRWGDYVLLGLCGALGLLSKLNFLVWAVALLGAALMLREWRPRLRPWRLVASIGLAVLVAGPALVWMVQNPQLSTEGLGKLRVEEAGGLEVRIAVTGELVLKLLGVYLLAGLVLGVVWFRTRRKEVPAGLQLAAAASALSVAVVWALFLASGSGAVEERWLLPTAWALVPAVAVPAWRALAPRGRRVMAVAVAAPWLLAMVGLPLAGVVEVGARGIRFEPLAARLEEMGAPGRPVFVASVPVAGNLLHVAPGLQPRLLRPGIDLLPVEPAILVAPFDDPVLNDAEVLRRERERSRLDMLDGSSLFLVVLDAG